MLVAIGLIVTKLVKVEVPLATVVVIGSSVLKLVVVSISVDVTVTGSTLKVLDIGGLGEMA